MKSLNTFPKRSVLFDHEAYGHDVRIQTAADSPYDGEYGLELELEGRRLPEVVRWPAIGGSRWQAKPDGSLRNGGMEYVLDRPCGRADVGPLARQLFDGLAAAGSTIANTTRCSTHVHVNMRGVKVPELASFVASWGIVEDVLTLWCGGHRAGNHFALRFSDSHYIVDGWVDAFKVGSFRFSGDRKYVALNGACLSTFGSLEIRTMRGADNVADVENWVDIIDRLRRFARSIADPSELAGIFSGDGPAMFAERIFGPDIVAQLRAACREHDESFEDLIRFGFRRIQPIIYSLPWGDVIKAAARVYIPNPFGSDEKPRRTIPVGLRA